MKKIKNKLKKDNIIIAFLLTFIGGFLDSYTYILYDKVFANTQTGNLIFFSMYLTQGKIQEAFYRIAPIVAFCISIIFVQAIEKKYINFHTIIMIWINIILLILIGFINLQHRGVFVTSSISFICANIIVVFRKVQGDAFAPTMCTGNLRSCMLHFSESILNKNLASKQVAFKYLCIIIIFCIGVCCGFLCTSWLKKEAIFICVAIFFVILIILEKEEHIGNMTNKN